MVAVQPPRAGGGHAQRPDGDQDGQRGALAAAHEVSQVPVVAEAAARLAAPRPSAPPLLPPVRAAGPLAAPPCTPQNRSPRGARRTPPRPAARPLEAGGAGARPP